MTKKYDNNNNIIASRAYFLHHFIIASRAYSLQSPTCTRVNNLVDTYICNTYGIHVLSIRVACGKADLQI
jgi:hypothetical protein